MSGHRDRVVHVRVTAAEAAAIAAVAGPGGVSGWLRRLIHEALSRPSRDTERVAS